MNEIEYYEKDVIDLRGKLPVNPNPKRKYKRRKLSKIKKLVLHCDDWDTDIFTIAEYDVTPNPKHHISKKGCPECTYHYFIEKNGDVMQCVDLNKISWHAGNHNGKSAGVCMRYRATGNKYPPPIHQLEAAESLLAYLCLKLGVDPDNVYGHRELYGTGWLYGPKGIRKLRKTCPGLLVNMDLVRYNVAIKVQKVLKDNHFYNSKIDGIFGPKSEAALKQYHKQITK